LIIYYVISLYLITFLITYSFLYYHIDYLLTFKKFYVLFIYFIIYLNIILHCLNFVNVLLFLFWLFLDKQDVMSFPGCKWFLIIINEVLLNQYSIKEHSMFTEHKIIYNLLI